MKKWFAKQLRALLKFATLSYGVAGSILGALSWYVTGREEGRKGGESKKLARAQGGGTLLPKPDVRL